MFEVHSIDAGNCGWHGEESSPRRQLPRDRQVCCACPDIRLGLESKSQHFPERFDIFLDASDMIGDVAEQRLHLRIDREDFGVFAQMADLGRSNTALRRRSSSRRSM